MFSFELGSVSVATDIWYMCNVSGHNYKSIMKTQTTTTITPLQTIAI